MNTLLNLWLSFLAGLFAPIGAICVLPLYPGFLAYLASQVKDQKTKISTLGWMVTLGVISSMFLFGLIFTTFLSASLTKAIGIISPIAFSFLALFSLLLIFNLKFSKFLPKISAPLTKNPWLSSYSFGFFFGAIVLPCNPASLVVLFALSTSTIGFIENLLSFLLFGVGMSLPLLILSYISQTGGRKIASFLAQKQRIINFLAGLIMLIISLYYLIFVFHVFA